MLSVLKLAWILEQFTNYCDVFTQTTAEEIDGILQDHMTILNILHLGSHITTVYGPHL